ncbi:MAG: hypothetical protein ACT4QF_18445 [Sporichthyaceae bacterium]
MAPSAQRCQHCEATPPMTDDVLCGPCAAPVQVSWGIAHSRGAQRGENVRWEGRRRAVETVDLHVDVL